MNAVECAVAIQKGMATRNTDVAEHRRLQYRVCINLGDVIYDDARIYGDGINVAARLKSTSEPGGICISSKVYEDVRSKVKLAYEDGGEQQLKNIAQPVRVYCVRVLEETTPSPPLALPDRPSIAVLPFDNMSGDPEQECFVDGIVEDIITSLSRVRWLFVIARNSSFTYKGRAVDVKQVGRELGVATSSKGALEKLASECASPGSLSTRRRALTSGRTGLMVTSTTYSHFRIG